MTLLPDQGLPIAPPAIALILDNLATCVCEELATNGAGPTCWCGLYPGAAVSWEYCAGGECSPGTCGMGYVRVVNIYPSETFPQPIISERCHRPLAWAIEVGALRCLPVGTEAPTPTEMAEVAIRQYADAVALHNAISCCGIDTLALGAYQPLGPEGGCLGVVLDSVHRGRLMAVGARVRISDELLISALNTPGGPVYEWRDETGDWIVDYARATAPVNDVLDAMHRGGKVGGFKAGFYWDRYGGGHRIGTRVGNTADHAIYVEEGRSRSRGQESFSWTGHTPPGSIDVHERGTSARLGRHTLRNAVNARAAATGDFGPIFGV